MDENYLLAATCNIELNPMKPMIETRLNWTLPVKSNIDQNTLSDIASGLHV
jgi:hypothetical protein